MNPFELRLAFNGKTVTGAYVTGVTFTETYFPDGGITYRDDLGSDQGHWYVWGPEFCTFYQSMQGACFNIRRVGGNCFQAYAAAGAEHLTDEAALAPFLVAQLWRTDAISTCPALPIA
jgi:hypothetical protein